MYEGFDINTELENFEDKFKINVDIYEFDDSQVLKNIRMSMSDYNDTMNLLLISRHFCYNKFRCFV